MTQIKGSYDGEDLVMIETDAGWMTIEHYGEIRLAQQKADFKDAYLAECPEATWREWHGAWIEFCNTTIRSR